MLAACSATTPAPTRVTAPAEAETPSLPAPAPASQVVESNATYATDSDAQPPTRPVQTYPLAPTTMAALAREKLRGQVLVSGPVFPTAAAARSVVTTIDIQQPIAMRVIKDRGKVVQVATAAATDCVDGFAQHYELRVFVPRSSLVPRTTAEITRTFDDGTAFAIDRGAPVKITAGGLGWFDAMLDQTAAAPPERLAYSLVKPYVAAAIPPAPGERLVCDGAPMTKAEWAAHEQSERDRDAARTNAAARRVADARAAKRARAKTDAADSLLDLALHDGTSASSKISDEARRNLPYCGVAAASAPKPAAKLGGVAYAWNEPRRNDHVYRADDTRYLADVGASCGRVRLAVDAAAVRRVAAAESSAPRAVRQRVWIPKPGPVFWPDGKKAGKYTGRDERFLRVTERESLICVDVRGVAEEVCHRRADVTVEN
jgi:hypothetical protein